MILFFRSVMKRSMMSATAMIEAISKGQIGHPAALMISNNCFPSHDDGRHFSLRKSFQQGSRGTANRAHYGALAHQPRWKIAAARLQYLSCVPKRRCAYPHFLWISVCMKCQ